MAVTKFEPKHVAQFKRIGFWQTKKDESPSITLLGLGGGGSNILEVALRLSTAANKMKEITFACYDYDTLELHNLNRTLIYKLHHLGKTKAAAAQYINLQKYTVNKKVNKENYLYDSYTHIERRRSYVPLIIDARDTLDPTAMIPNSWIKMGYDGGSNISFTFHPEIAAKYIFNLNENNSYEVVPSFYVPAAIQATLCMYFTTFQHLVHLPQDLEHVGTVHFHIDDLLKKVGTTWGNEQ